MICLCIHDWGKGSDIYLCLSSARGSCGNDFGRQISDPFPSPLRWATDKSQKKNRDARALATSMNDGDERQRWTDERLRLFESMNHKDGSSFESLILSKMGYKLFYFIFQSTSLYICLVGVANMLRTEAIPQQFTEKLERRFVLPMKIY